MGISVRQAAEVAVAVGSPSGVLVGMYVPIGSVGCKTITVGIIEVGAAEGVGKLGMVGEGSGVGESSIVANALPGVAKKSATTKDSSATAGDWQAASRRRLRSIR